VSSPISDDEIAEMVGESKAHVAPASLRPVKPKRGQLEARAETHGTAGRRYVLIARQNVSWPQDFSVILAVDLGSSRLFRLRRHNGDSHVHSNKIEGDTLRGCHMHIATARYQQRADTREDAFAVATEDYADLAGAVDLMLKITNVDPGPQPPLFP
jgi:hypothetical protein